MSACGYSLATNLPSLPQAVPRVKKVFETWTYLAVETLHSASMESSVQTLLACARCGWNSCRSGYRVFVIEWKPDRLCCMSSCSIAKGLPTATASHPA